MKATEGQTEQAREREKGSGCDAQLSVSHWNNLKPSPSKWSEREKIILEVSKSSFYIFHLQNVGLAHVCPFFLPWFGL